MKHILFAHRKLSYGGGERVLLEQVGALAELPVRVSVLFDKEPDRRDIEPELHQRHPRVQDVVHCPSAFQAWRWLRRERPDLIVLCNHKPVQAALPWIGARIPTVVTLHEHYERHLRKYKGIASRVDRWIITWPFEAQVRRLLGEAPCSEIAPLYPRPEATLLGAPERSAARRACGLPEDALVVGYVGQMDGRKDPLATLRLAEHLQAHLGQELHVLFAGREEDRTARALDAAVAASPLAGRIRRLGPVPEVHTPLAALDLYLMTSRNEGFFPIALIEAMERGIPIVAPSVGGIATRLVDGEGGFLLSKPDDRQPIAPELLSATAARVAEVLKDPRAWEAIRLKARELARSLTEGYDAAGRFREALQAWIP